MAEITLKGNKIHTVGELPPVGKTVPFFTLVGQDLSEKTLADFKGKKKILNIFPSIDTTVCGASVKEFTKQNEKKPDIYILNISKDLPFAQVRFCKIEEIKNVITLSAFRSNFPEDYGVCIADGPLKGLCARAVIVLDEDNKVLYHELVPEITQEPNYELAMKHV